MDFILNICHPVLLSEKRSISIYVHADNYDIGVFILTSFVPVSDSSIITWIACSFTIYLSVDFDFLFRRLYHYSTKHESKCEEITLKETLRLIVVLKWNRYMCTFMSEAGARKGEPGQHSSLPTWWR